MGPTVMAWFVVAFPVISFLRTHTLHLGKGRWVLYGLFVFCLHLLASMTVWALAIQIWSQIPWPTSLTAGLSLALDAGGLAAGSCGSVFCVAF